MPRIKTFVAIGCTHRPVHDEDYCKWVIKQIRKIKPDILVHCGDLIDMKCLSRFISAGMASLIEEYESANKFIEKINKAIPDARKVFIEGNHDSRVWRGEHKAIAAVADYRKHIPAMKGWRNVPYINGPSGIYTFGQITCSHGFQASPASEKTEAFRFGVSNGLYIRAHTHQGHSPKEIPLTPKVGTKYWIANTGCGIRSDEGYFKEWDTDRWNRGLITGWADTKQRDWGKPHWEAEFILHSMVGDDK